MYSLICENCHQTFEVKEKRHFDGNRKRKYCSLKCSGPSVYEKRKDEFLKTSFKKGHKYFPYGNAGEKIVNPPKLLFGKDNPAYIHGKKCGKRKKLYTKIANDNFDKFCLICKEIKNLHIHHIDGNGLNHVVENLCFLCNSCHQRFHRCKNKLSNPHYISGIIEEIISKLNLRNDFLKIKRRRYLLRKELSPSIMQDLT